MHRFKKTVLGSVLLSVLSLPLLANASVVKSVGGLKLEDGSRYFKIGGVIRVDQTAYLGRAQDKQLDFPSGGRLRTAEMTVSGGFAPRLGYELTVGFKPGQLELSDAYLTYRTENASLMIGEVPPNYSLESTKSSKWLGFLERGMPASTFGAHYGLGINARVWHEMASLGVAVVQPKYDHGQGNLHSDRISSTARLHVALARQANQVLQLGVSTLWRRFETEQLNRATGLISPALSAGYRSTFASHSRNQNANLVGTGLLQARNAKHVVLETAFLRGPWYLQAEYFQARLALLPQKSSVSFKGWDLQTKYVLTGETRDYDFVGGSFGRIRPSANKGAYEVSARYSYVNLTDKMIQGGSAHDTTLAFSWYANDNVRVIANAIRTHIHPLNGGPVRKINTLASRLQVVW